MGLFRRREAPAEPAASPEPAEPPVAPAPADPGPPAWATLPPLTPTVSAPASTFKIGAAVKEDLVALDSPRLSHGMGHLVSSDGPPGVISGLARTSVQRQASTAAGGPLDMPMAPTSTDGPDGTSVVEPEPDASAATGTVFVPRLVPDSNGGSTQAWSPPASPTSAAAPAPPPARDLPLAPSPTIQRQADPGAPMAAPEPAGATSAAESSVLRATTGLADAGVPTTPVIQRSRAGPTNPTPTAAPTIERARDHPLAPSGPRTSAGPLAAPSGPGSVTGAHDPTAASAPTVQRAPTGLADPAVSAAPTVPRAGADTAGSATLTAEPAPAERPSLTLPTAPRTSLQRQAAELPALTLPTAQPNAGGTSGPGLTTAQRSATEAASSALPAADESSAAEPLSVQTEPAAARPRPRPGALGPPLETRPLHVLMAVQRSADPHAAAAPAAGPVPPPLTELPIRARPHPSVQRSVEQGGRGAVVHPTVDSGPGAEASLPVTPDPSGRTASPPPELESEGSEPDLAQPEAVESVGTAVPSVPLPLAPAVGRGEAPHVPVVGQSGPVGFVPLVAQRSLAGPAPVPAPSAPRAAHETAPVAMPSWSVPIEGPVVQRWPDLSSVRHAGRGLAERASDAGSGLLARGRDAVGNAMPDLPTMPEAPEMPSLGSLPGVPSRPDVPSVQQLPGVPRMPSLQQLPSLPASPSVPSLPSMPSMPALPSLPAMPLAPSLPQMPHMPAMPSLPSFPGLPGTGGGGGGGGGDVPMTEIVFPAPSDGGGGGGGATTPAPAPEPSAPAAPAAAPGGGAGAAGTGDLDELAHKLYDRIRWRMRSELRLDMERAGLGAGTGR